VEVMHTQFRVSEDHKLRALLKKQSARVSDAAPVIIHIQDIVFFILLQAEEKLKIERGELEPSSDVKSMPT
jgi:hypothetical protein